MSRFSRNMARTGLVLLSPLLMIVVLESGCHIFNLGYPTRFLIPFQRNGEAVWIDNQLFGYRFFVPTVSRAPTPIIVPQNKSTNEFRVVVLGESAAMGEPEPAYGPAHLLEYMLIHDHPERNITVINAAMTAINSHVIREISRDLNRLKPDVVILYVGNNEVVGPYGPGTVFQAFAASPAMNRLRAMLTRLRLSSAIRDLWYRRNYGDKQIWQGMEMFTANRVPENDHRLPSVYHSFDHNMRAIIRTAQSTGASVILSTIAVNLADQAPFDGSELNAASLDSLKKSRDADSLRFRADHVINQHIRSIATNDPSVILVDAESSFEKESPPGFNLFLDHVHVNFAGSHRLAALWKDAIAEMIPAPTNASFTEDDSSNAVLWNPFNALDVAEYMLERSSRAPFTATRDHEKRMLKWTEELADLYELTSEQSLDSLLSLYRERMEKFPHDSWFPQQAVRALLVEDRYQDAGEILFQLHQLVPHRADVRGWMVVMAAIAGRTNRIWSIMTEDAPAMGQLPADMLISASETLLQAGYRRESVEVLHIASQHFPHRMRLRVLLASRNAQAGNTEVAREQFTRLLEEYPHDDWIKEEYGIFLAMQGDHAGAENLLNPLRYKAVPADRLKWVQLLLYRRDIPAAEQELQAIIEAQPDNIDAVMMLAQLQLQQNQIPKAVALLEHVVQKNGWRGDAWAQLGNAYDMMNRPNDALNAYRRALPLVSDRNGVRRALAWMLATEGDPAYRNPAEADGIIQQVNSEDTHTLLVRAAVHAANNRFEEALLTTDQGLHLLQDQPDPGMLDQFMRSRALYQLGEAIRINR